MEEDKLTVEFHGLSDVIEPISKREAVQVTGEIISETDQIMILKLPEKQNEKNPSGPKKIKKRFACAQCAKKFSRNLELTKHTNTVHLNIRVRVRSRLLFKI